MLKDTAKMIVRRWNLFLRFLIVLLYCQTGKFDGHLTAEGGHTYSCSFVFC